jgi:hypothetical protein
MCVDDMYRVLVTGKCPDISTLANTVAIHVGIRDGFINYIVVKMHHEHSSNEVVNHVTNLDDNAISLT